MPCYSSGGQIIIIPPTAGLLVIMIPPDKIIKPPNTTFHITKTREGEEEGTSQHKDEIKRRKENLENWVVQVMA